MVHTYESYDGCPFFLGGGGKGASSVSPKPSSRCRFTPQSHRWKGGLSPFLHRIPASVLLRRLKPTAASAAYSPFRSPLSKKPKQRGGFAPAHDNEEPLELLDALRMLLRREVAWAVERMAAARTPASRPSSPLQPGGAGAAGAAVVGGKGQGPAVTRRGGAAKALDALFEGQGAWVLKIRWGRRHTTTHQR